MRKSLGFSVIALAALPLLLQGCGGSGDSEPSTLSKATFVRRANAVCGKASEKIFSEGSEATADGEGTEPRSDLVRTILVPGIEGEIEEVRDVGMPRGEEARVEAFFNALQKVADEANADSEKFLEDLGNGLRPYKKAEKLATEIGIPECGQP